MTMVSLEGPRPVLLCLNLHCAYIDPADLRYAPRGLDIISQAQACLSWARRQKVPVLHIHTNVQTHERLAPIPGCAPLPTEPVLQTSGWSVFASFARRASGPPQDAFVLGFTGTQECVAAAVEAQQHRARIVFLTDAIASPRLSKHDPDVVDDVLAELLGQWGARLTTTDLLRCDSWRILATVGG